MRYSISAETLIYSKPIREVIGFGEALSLQELLLKICVEDFLQRLANLKINVYFDLSNTRKLPRITSSEHFLCILEAKQREWAKEYG